MLRLPIGNFLNLGEQGVEARLFGHEASKKGSLKHSARAATSGLASRVIDAFHDDGRTFSCLVQVHPSVLQPPPALVSIDVLPHLAWAV
jgi:hypothetical protein